MNTEIGNTLYFPAEDSYLMAEAVTNYSGIMALEVGIGSGIVTEHLNKRFEVVVGTDLNSKSLVHARQRLNQKIGLVCCNFSDAIRSKFDLIVSNPPYLPNPGKAKLDYAIDGGPSGIEWSLNFLKVVVTSLKPSGKILLLTSSLSNILILDDFLRRWGLRKKQIIKRNLFFEALTVFQISRPGKT